MMNRVTLQFTAIVGQDRLKLALLLNAINPALLGVLIRGEKGTGKSTAVRALAELLPEKVRVVLEVPGGEDRGRDVCDVWTGPPTDRGLFARAFREHERLFVHDGLVGYGAVSPDGLTELFLDEHKLIYFFTRDMDGPDAVLARLGVPTVATVRHFSELGHVHSSLCGKGDGEPYWEVAEELRRTLGLEWEETKEYS